MQSRVFRKLFAPAAVSARFQAKFPTELSLRPSQLKASAEDTVAMTPSAAALAKRYGELKMPIVIMAGLEIGWLISGVNPGQLDEVLAESTLVAFEGAGHMIHYSAPEKVVDGINLAASRSEIDEHSQLLPMQPPITTGAGQRPKMVSAPRNPNTGIRHQPWAVEYAR
jgi:pimeloyl-ACP methyl ester carboxylesterase